MLQGTLYVDCPCCGARIEARREDGKVVAHWAKPLKKSEANPDPIKAATEKMKADKERLARYLAGAKDVLEEQKREALRKFEQEKERIKRENDTSPPPRPFDND